MSDITVGYAICGSFCTFRKTIEQLKILKEKEVDIIPIMSFNAYTMDTRFGKASDFISEIEDICGKKIIHTIDGAEPIGPKRMLDVLAVAPCTGNTAAKLANGITDTPVTMAAKAHLRSGRPVVIALATNDALSGSAKNIGALMNTRNYYFVPFGEDNPVSKPTSAVCDFDRLPDAIFAALNGEQLQPIIFG